MKYTRFIFAFMVLNLFIAFLMVYVGNNTREVEKKNNKLIIQISKINKDIHINNIELTSHKNIDYLNKLYKIYFYETNSQSNFNIISLRELSNQDQYLKLVKNITSKN